MKNENGNANYNKKKSGRRARYAIGEQKIQEF